MHRLENLVKFDRLANQTVPLYKNISLSCGSHFGCEICCGKLPDSFNDSQPAEVDHGFWLSWEHPAFLRLIKSSCYTPPPPPTAACTLQIWTWLPSLFISLKDFCIVPSCSPPFLGHSLLLHKSLSTHETIGKNVWSYDYIIHHCKRMYMAYGSC